MKLSLLALTLSLLVLAYGLAAWIADRLDRRAIRLHGSYTRPRRYYG